MYVEINSRNEENQDSAGKTSWVNTEEPKWLLSTAAAPHLGKVAWHVNITTQATYQLSSGERGGESKAVIRKLEVHLTPKDVATLLRLVLANGLVELKVSDGTEN